MRLQQGSVKGVTWHMYSRNGCLGEVDDGDFQILMIITVMFRGGISYCG
jgi:hypothetical protein